MDIKGEHREFEPLPMRRRSLAAIDASQYCIWTDAGEKQEIKADTAYEAVMKSGRKNIIKIERIFNSRQHILDKSLLEEETPPAGFSVSDPESVHERIGRRRNPIISASELDEMMRSLQEHAGSLGAELSSKSEAAGENMSLPIPPEPDPARPENENAVFRPPVPPPQEAPNAMEPVSAVGLDVHNDGFDEIIPAAPQVKASSARPPSESREPPSLQNTLPVPEAKELSAEEVEKLLQGKSE